MLEPVETTPRARHSGVNARKQEKSRSETKAAMPPRTSARYYAERLANSSGLVANIARDSSRLRTLPHSSFSVRRPEFIHEIHIRQVHHSCSGAAASGSC